jgi:hypothetical protein
MRSAETLLESSREIGLEVNTEKSKYRVSCRSGIIGNIGVLPQLLENMLSISTIHANTNVQTFLLVQENGVDCLWCDLTACSDISLLKMLLAMVPELKDIL